MALPDPGDVTASQARRLALEPIAYPRATAVDHYDLDDGDATHPIHVNFLLPSTAATIGKITLSWHNMPFRSTSSLNPSSVGSDATAESGHSHSHGHSVHVTADSGGVAVNAAFLGSGLGIGDFSSGISYDTGAIVNSNAAGSSGHSHSHSHTLTGSASQAVTDGATSNVTALSIDGQDYTAQLGGPWSGDVVEMDITSVFPTRAGMWHELLLSLAGLGRVVSMLRIYYT